MITLTKAWQDPRGGMIFPIGTVFIEQRVLAKGRGVGIHGPLPVEHEGIPTSRKVSIRVARRPGGRRVKFEPR